MRKYQFLLQVRADEKLHTALKAEAVRRRLSIANLVRDLLADALAEQAATDGRAALEKAIRKSLQPDINRLAQLVVRATKQARLAAGLGHVVLQKTAGVSASEARDIYESVEQKAAAWIGKREEVDGS